MYAYCLMRKMMREVGWKIYLIKNLISASLNDKINLTFISRHLLSCGVDDDDELSEDKSQNLSFKCL
jgi:hypothetical protein